MLHRLNFKRRNWSQNAYAHALITALMLLSFAGWNGGAIPYPDTRGYMRPALFLAKKVASEFHVSLKSPTDLLDQSPQSALSNIPSKKSDPTSNRIWGARSAYWGLFAYLLYSSAGFWAIVGANAVMLGIALALAWSRGFGLLFGWAYHAACFFIATLTSAGVFVALLTPDILAPVLIISLALLILRWTLLSAPDRLILIAMATLAIISHASHLALAVAFVFAALILKFVVRDRVWDRRAAAVAVPLAVGIASTLLFNFAVKVKTGYPPTNLPFLAAHISDIPAAQAVLNDACPAAGYELCNHLNQFEKGTWISFLFNSTADKGGVYSASSQSVRDRLEAEQQQVLLYALKSRPFAIGGHFLRDGLRQIWVIDLGDIAPHRYLATFPIQYQSIIVDDIKGTRIVQKPVIFEQFSTIQSIISFFAFWTLLLMGWASRTYLMRDGHLTGRFVVLVFVGVFLNAMICGMAASPLGRFQARVVFLLPFLAAGLIVAKRTRSGTTQSNSGASPALPQSAALTS